MSFAIDDRALAAHVLLAIADKRGRRTVQLDEVASDVGARRADVRRVVSALHAEGFVDALRMRPTLAGLALAASLAPCKLAELRPARGAHAEGEDARIARARSVA